MMCESYPLERNSPLKITTEPMVRSGLDFNLRDAVFARAMAFFLGHARARGQAGVCLLIARPPRAGKP
jgi:hypothetical protein